MNAADINTAILAERMAAYDTIEGPRVGDFVRFADGALARIAYLWPDDFQPTCERFGAASFYLGGHMRDGRGAYVSHSGSLDPGVPRHTLTPTAELLDGSVWIFDQDIAGAHRDVRVTAPFRVFTCSLESHKPAIHLRVVNAL